MAIIQRIVDLTAGLTANIDDTALFEVEDKNHNSVSITGAQVRLMIGALTFTGDATGTGYIGAIALTIATGAVTRAKMAAGTANKVLGYDGSGAVVEYSAGSGVTFSGSQISASAPAGAAPSATRYTHRQFRGL